MSIGANEWAFGGGGDAGRRTADRLHASIPACEMDEVVEKSDGRVDEYWMNIDLHVGGRCRGALLLFLGCSFKHLCDGMSVERTIWTSPQLSTSGDGKAYYRPQVTLIVYTVTASPHAAKARSLLTLVSHRLALSS